MLDIHYVWYWNTMVDVHGIDNIRILCLIYTMYGIGILWYMYTVHSIDNIRILCLIYTMYGIGILW